MKKINNERSRKDLESKKKTGLPLSAIKFPKHITNLSLLMRNNSEIRRLTAIGIINYLRVNNSDITENDKIYIKFKWTKFSIGVNGLIQEHNYNEAFFINALIASFTTLSKNAQNIMDVFCQNEFGQSISEIANMEVVNAIEQMNDEYLAKSSLDAEKEDISSTEEVIEA